MPTSPPEASTPSPVTSRLPPSSPIAGRDSAVLAGMTMPPSNNAGGAPAGGRGYGNGNVHGIQNIEVLKEVFLLSNYYQGILLLLVFTILTGLMVLWWRLFGILITPRKAVMRSQDRSRRKSRLDHTTTASGSPPAPEGEASGVASNIQAPSPTKSKPDTSSFSTASSSYFPQMPPRNLSSSNAGAMPSNIISPGVGPHDKPLPSGTSTPASFAFQPRDGASITPLENPDFPTPNMYELALMLHSEAGIDAFWSNVVKIATTCYKAERVTLAVPSDSTDLENTPWGQKATFNIAEGDCLSLTYMGDEKGCVGDSDEPASAEDYGEAGTQMGGFDAVDKEECRGRRPVMPHRVESEDSTEPLHIDRNSEEPFSPVTIGISEPLNYDNTDSSDWISETSGLSPLEPPQPPPLPPELRRLSQDRNACYGGVDEDELRGRVFPTLQPLSYEADALLDGAGVSRVLQRGKTVVLSREYRDIKGHLEERERERRRREAETIANAKTSPPNGSMGRAGKGRPGLGKLDLSSIDGMFPSAPQSYPPPTPFYFPGRSGRKKKKGSNAERFSTVLPFCSTQQHFHPPYSRSPSPHRTSYEEYEQPITSPWSQSPHPSPAPKQDPTENPFFAPPKVDEETFNPTATSPVYSAQEPVNAIGLESAWTIIHIPLIHPSSSKGTCYSGTGGSAAKKTPPRHDSPFGGSMAMPGNDILGNGIGQKKAPIGILSILSPAIPYPKNLIHSLSHFAPLVATAYSLAQSHSSIMNQLSHFRYKRSLRKQTIDADTLLATSRNGAKSPETVGASSLTSPSEFSTSSMDSTTGSRVVSPGWDPGIGGNIEGKGKSNSHSPLSAPGSPDVGYRTSGGYFEKPRSRGKIFSRQNSENVVTTLCGIGRSASGLDSIQSVETRLSSQDEDSSKEEEITGPLSDNKGIGVPSDWDSVKTQLSGSLHAALGAITPEKQDSDLLATSGLLIQTEQSEASTKPATSSQPRRQRLVVRKKRTLVKLGQGHYAYQQPHSHLHSYGADYSATFQSLASTSTSSVPGTPSRRPGSSSSRVSSPNTHEMPPPKNKLLRTIIDSIPVHVFTATPHSGETTWVNARMLAYRGLTPEEFMKGPYDAFHPEDRDEYIKRWSVAVRKGDPFSHQVRVRRFDGEYRWFMIRAVPLRDSRGIIVHWFGTNMDINDQRLAELDAARQAEMAESESKYRSLANSSPQIVFAATANDGITFANTQWLEYSGQTLEQAIRLGFMENVHPADRYKCALPGLVGSPKVASPSTDSSPDPSKSRTPNYRRTEGERRQAFKKISDEDKPTFSTELRLKDKHGNYRWHLVRCVSVETNFGNGEGLWFGTCTDINDHKLLEKTLKEANEAAQKTMESKTRFLANMSHEIRTPLIGISGMVNFLLDTPLSGEQLDYCHTISQSSDGLLSVINDILDLSKVEAGMMRLNPEWFRVHSLLEDANELLSTMAISKDLELNYIVDEDVPTVVCGDRVRLRQVLLNVIGNAIKFTSKGEVFSRCLIDREAKVAEDEIMLRYECYDTGPGFDKEDEGLMFKPFSQIDGSSTRTHGGSGLGLVISRQLIELHGGKMSAYSEKGKGSTFICSAKFKIPSSKEEPSSSSEAAPDKSPPIAKYTERPQENRVLEEEGRFTNSPSSLPNLNIPDEPHSATASSINSDPSAFFARSPLDGSPALSLHHVTLSQPSDPLQTGLSLPSEAKEKLMAYSFSNASSVPDVEGANAESSNTAEPKLNHSSTPPMFNILIVSEQFYSRIAISHHIKVTLPKNVPSQITTASKYSECINMISGDDPVVFTHIVINLPDHLEIISLMSQVYQSPIHTQTTLMVLTNPTQRTAIIKGAPPASESRSNRLQFIYKPIKPSRFGYIFDPTNERDASTDRNRDSAQQVVESQKRVFSQMEKEVGNKGHKVLLVEDNIVNQKVLLRFLAKVGLEVDTAGDGEKCVEKVFSKKPGHYGLILCDLHMPRKDGFQATAEIRRWEQDHNMPPTPIVALSANVMSDVADRCSAAGFSRYVSKPVDFKELSQTIKDLLLDPYTHQSFMSQRRRDSSSRN
ncbi:hypothetical protein RUND412_009241 [Rhizina undulata]